jgi:hypothetical protein
MTYSNDRRIHRFTLVALAALLPACAVGGAPREAASPPEPPPPSASVVDRSSRKELADLAGSADERLAMRGQLAAPGAPAGKSSPTSDSASRASVLIYTADVTMAVFEVSASLGRVEAIGRELGGFLAKRDDKAITIRVPSAVFDDAVKRIEAVGDVIHRNVTAEDVTEEFRDLEVRLRSAHAVQVRLTELLAKAAKVEESIAIERELDRVSAEIERVEGRMKFLRDRAAFSTITVHFDAKATDQVGEASVRLPVPWLYNINLSRLLKL